MRHFRNDLNRMGMLLLFFFALPAVLMAGTGGEEFDVQARLYKVVVIAESNVTRTSVVDLPFTERSIEGITDSILSISRQDGYYYARLNVSEIIRSGDSVTVVMRLFAGAQIRIAKIIYSGLRMSSPDLIDKYLPMRKDDLITDKSIADAEKAAASIPFLKISKPLIIRPRPGYTEVDVEYVFSEPKQVRLIGGGGYIPENNRGLVWNIDLSLRNLFGGGRKIGLRSERRESNRNILNIQYVQPLFLIGVGELQFNAGNRDYRDSFSEFSLSTNYQSKVGESFGIGLGLGWKRVEPIRFGFGYSRYNLGFQLNSSTLDNNQNPSRGMSLSSSINLSHRSYSSFRDDFISSGNTFTEIRTELRAEFYKSVASPLIATVSFAYLGLETNELLPPLSELFLIGGPESIRGFRNEQFEAISAVYGTFEPRIRFNDEGYLFVFADAGYLSNRVLLPNDGIETEKLFRYSGGTGISLVSGPRSLKLSLGWIPGVRLDQPRLSVQFSSDL